MKKRNFLYLLEAACFLLISLLLQSCGGTSNLPIQTEEEPLLTITIEREEQRLIEGKESNTLPAIMPELWQYIFSYLDFEGILAARSVSVGWNKLITGYREAGIVGVENKPQHIIDTTGWIKEKEMQFDRGKLKNDLTPATIPSFAFYHLMGQVSNLPQSFWPHLQGSRVHTLNLGWSQIGVARTIELAKALPIRDAGARELAKALPKTQVHTLSLNGNQIGAAEASELAKALPKTQVHTLSLNGNQIGAAGASELVKALPRAQVHTLHLGSNEIGAAGAIELAKVLPRTHVHTLNLSYNEIGDAGAIELAKALPATQLHTLNVWANQIGDATQKLLVKQYPHIKWTF